MKYLCALAFFAFFLVGSVSAQHCPNWTPEEGWNYDCEDGEGPDWADDNDDGVDPNPGTGTPDPDGSWNVVDNPTPCGTNVVLLEEITFPCGSGFGSELVWKYSCTAGNIGTCTTGFETTYDGCFDGELPEEETPNLNTVTCT